MAGGLPGQEEEVALEEVSQIKKVEADLEELDLFRYCLDPADRGEESEEEVWEEVATPRGEGGEDMDTDEEVEQLKLRDAREEREAELKQKTKVKVEAIKKEREKAEQAVNEKLCRAAEGKERAEKTAEKKADKEALAAKIKSEAVERASSSKPVNASSYDADTDNEMEGIQPKDANITEKVSVNPFDEETDDEDNVEPEPKKTEASVDEDSAYDAETDVDDDVAEELRRDTAGLELPVLPQHFAGMEFLLHGEWEEGEEDLVSRYIVAAGGRVVGAGAARVERVVTASNWWSAELGVVAAAHPGAKVLRASWVFACHDTGEVVAEERYRLRE